MRQIKFRFWRDNKMQIAHAMNAYDDNNFAGDGEILMQFTGLLDCEGKEVYEGDIIEEYNSPIYREVVAWDSENGAWGYFSSQGNYNWAHEWGESQGTPLSQMKVIGNLYEHPQLLNND